MPSKLKQKKHGFGLEMRTYSGKDGSVYLVFKTGSGSFHTFVETEAKEAAKQCGAISGTTINTRQMWSELWKSKT